MTLGLLPGKETVKKAVFLSGIVLESVWGEKCLHGQVLEKLLKAGGILIVGIAEEHGFLGN